MDDRTFEQRVLAPVATETPYPPTPALRSRVLATIAAQPAAPSPRRAGRRRALALAMAAAVVVLAGVVAALPRSREAVADFFGIAGSKIEVLPTTQPGVTPTPFPTPVGLEWIATPTSLAGAGAASGFTPALPAGQGAPDGVYLVDYGTPPVVVLHYPRFDLWQSRTVGFFGKGVPPELIIHDFTINGRPATWISGGSHIVRFLDARGREVSATARTVGRNTLVWSTPTTFYRLETDLSEQEATAIAASLP